jgi:glycosyltransferase involved in cell wall biosynthesis
LRNGHEVTRIESNFIHREKVKRDKKYKKDVDTIYIDTIPYKKNLSFRRLFSHYNFAKKVYKLLDNQTYDMIYVFVPANSLLKFAAIYKSNNPAVKLIADVIDLWPESLPFSHFKKIWPITQWAALRNDNLSKCDHIILECGLYQKILKEHIKNVKNSVIYWPRKITLEFPEFSENESILNICYLGSINNIIDIKFITNLMIELNKLMKTILHIIGDGEKKEKFLTELSVADIPYIYYGSIYDEYKKMKILSSCDYGLNIMKGSVCVGVTMKSVDYMHVGLPMINNIRGDIWDLIESYSLGINCISESYADVAKKLVNDRSIMNKNRRNIRLFYERFFSKEAYYWQMETCFKELLI